MVCTKNHGRTGEQRMAVCDSHREGQGSGEAVPVGPGLHHRSGSALGPGPRRARGAHRACLWSECLHPGPESLWAVGGSRGPSVGLPTGCAWTVAWTLSSSKSAGRTPRKVLAQEKADWGKPLSLLAP